MENATSTLFDLDGFRVVSVVEHDAARRVVIAGVAVEQACPGCGVFSSRVHSRVLRRVKDLPYGRALRIWWDKRRFACGERACRRRTFTETNAQLGRRRRLTLRLRNQLERAVSRSARSVADVAREYGVSQWSVNQALTVAAARLTGHAPAGVRLLGVDETRARSVRWLLAEAGWRRSDPWMTSFVDLDPTHRGGLLGLAPGRSSGSVRGWLSQQGKAFRDGIEVVAIDPSAPFAAGLRDLLPQATLVVDHWHLHRLANLMVTQVRQRVTQQTLGHRGRKADDVWAYRRLLLRGGRHLSDRQWTRLVRTLREDDPTGQIQAAWAGKECLRQLLDALPATVGPLVVDRRYGRDAPPPPAAGLRPYEIRTRLDRFYTLAADADLPELTRLAETLETWWPAVEAFIRLRITNARTEGYNTTIKSIKRVARGFSNQTSYQRRIMLHIAATAA